MWWAWASRTLIRWKIRHYARMKIFHIWALTTTPTSSLRISTRPRSRAMCSPIRNEARWIRSYSRTSMRLLDLAPPITPLGSTRNETLSARASRATLFVIPTAIRCSARTWLCRSKWLQNSMVQPISWSARSLTATLTLKRYSKMMPNLHRGEKEQSILAIHSQD